MWAKSSNPKSYDLWKLEVTRVISNLQLDSGSGLQFDGAISWRARQSPFSCAGF